MGKPMMVLGTVALLGFIFGVPAVLVPTAMDDVPGRSMTRVISVHQEALNIAARTFEKHRRDDHPGRLSPLPQNTGDWIRLINPLGRKAPGGGLAILPQADNTTGAIGIRGDSTQVVATVPAYRELQYREVVLLADGSLSASQDSPQ
jgi:hypothetical protein